MLGIFFTDSFHSHCQHNQASLHAKSPQHGANTMIFYWTRSGVGGDTDALNTNTYNSENETPSPAPDAFLEGLRLGKWHPKALKRVVKSRQAEGIFFAPE